MTMQISRTLMIDYGAANELTIIACTVFIQGRLSEKFSKKAEKSEGHHFYLNNRALSADCLKLLKQIFAQEAKHASFEGGKYQ